MDPWWTPLQSGWIGGIGASAVGVLGGVVGTLAGLCTPRGKCKRLLLGLMIFAIVGGLVSLAAGLFAVLSGQPRFVWHPLLLLGGITSGVFEVRKRYERAERGHVEEAK